MTDIGNVPGAGQPTDPTGKTTPTTGPQKPNMKPGSAYNVAIYIALMGFYNACGANYTTSLGGIETFNNLLQFYSNRELEISNQIAAAAKLPHNTALVAQLKGEQMRVQNLVTSTQATISALTQMQATLATQMTSIAQFFAEAGQAIVQNM